jgi:hypothetical protein
MDLLPLYIDDCCSEESRQIVNAHLEECPDCRQALKEMRMPFMSSPQLGEITPEQTLQKGIRKVRSFMLRSLTIAVSIMIALAALFLTWQMGNGFLNRSYEIDYQSKCFFLDTSSGTLSFTGESTFTIVGRGSSKRFSTEAGNFQGHVEVAAYPIPFAESFRQFSCSIDDDLVQITNHAVQLIQPDAVYWYWIFISPDDPDICFIQVHNLQDNTVSFAICGDSEAEARENYQKYREAFSAMVESGKK